MVFCVRSWRLRDGIDEYGRPDLVVFCTQSWCLRDAFARWQDLLDASIRKCFLHSLGV